MLKTGEILPGIFFEDTFKLGERVTHTNSRANEVGVVTAIHLNCKIGSNANIVLYDVEWNNTRAKGVLTKCSDEGKYPIRRGYREYDLQKI